MRQPTEFGRFFLQGLGRTAQRGQEQISAPGDLAIADTTEPFEIANRHDFKLFCFAIPRRLLPKGLLDRPRLNLSTTKTGRALSPERSEVTRNSA